MEKKSLLVVAALLMALSAAAQLTGVDGVVPARPLSLSRVQPLIKEIDVRLRAPGEELPSPHRSPELIKPYYLRPAGAFYSPFVAENGVGLYSLGFEFIQVKPYSDYTYYSVVDGADENDEMIWENTSGGAFNTYYSRHLTVNYGLEMVETPVFYLYHGDLDVDECFQYPHYVPIGNGYIINNLYPAYIYSAPYASFLNDGEDGYELLLSSKTMCQGGRDGNLSTMFVTYNDAVPFDNNTYGRWFGKNGGHFDGVAQAFEKPTHPYLLRKVCMQTAYLSCEDTVQLCCKVYRIDEIPAYRDDGPVELSDNFGEPIVIGYATVTPSTNEETNGLVTFTLTSHDAIDPSLIYECTPTIDYPILVVIEDYNDPECDGLRDFTCLVCADIHVDEGYGELAYLKCPVNDEEGNFTGRYVWKGLNNLFSLGEIKTGYSIFIVADQPYLVFNHNTEDGVFVFPDVTAYDWDDGDENSIEVEFLSSIPCSDDDWSVTCSGLDLPDWLEIELVDGGEAGQFDGLVTAVVTADPLPKGVNYREAVVRFAIPGDYKDCTFIQKRPFIPVIPPDVNRDGEVNIADVNCLIDIILGYKSVDDFDGWCVDVNWDNEVNIADVNAVIDAILGND